MKALGYLFCAVAGIALVLFLWIGLARADLLEMKEISIEGLVRVSQTQNARPEYAKALLEIAQKSGAAQAQAAAVVQAEGRAAEIKADESLFDDVENFKRWDNYHAQHGRALEALLAALDAVPEIKAQKEFRDLKADIEGLETSIENERHDYNEFALQYNGWLTGFPGEFLAKREGLKARPFLTTKGEKK